MSTSFLEHKVFEGMKDTVDILKCGETKGPFRFRRIQEKSYTSGSVEITLFDIIGEMYRIEVEENDITRRLNASPNPLFANCVVLLTKDIMQILMTKDVVGKDPLFATLIAEKFVDLSQKKFECSKCHIAKFSSIQSLKTHEELYCPVREMEVTSTAEEIDRPNLLLLPLTYHDLPQNNVVKIIGPMHSIVPVAIGRGTETFTTNPLNLGNICGDLIIPQNLNINLPQLSINIPVNGIFDTNRATLLPSTSSNSSSPKSKSSEPEKPFVCTCGVSFLNEQTFDAHKNFYCKNAPNTKTNGEFSKKFPEKCGQCNFRPQSSSQLAMHIRSAHQSTKTYICTVCSYRAFSLRGIRTHMRSHPSSDALKFESK
ncbi:unnamed protein product [Caenorhabditis angaria]|uniref:C2H2-type domain-containing protein n=1 Tax=Caenorhabditis angaria TaxID=860376 RepID=A0A9P1MW13_9PELO|nr:unnamed protein product [Caenorhabditis angaria]